MKYYKNLDGLRAVAAITVFFNHFGPKFEHEIYLNSAFLKNLFTQFQHGVSLFFVLSGFVITRILFTSYTRENYFQRFYWRRILRIFPLYYTYLIFHFFILSTILYGKITPLILQLPTYLFLQNFNAFEWFPELSSPGHFWTLAVEEHFYLFWPAIVFLFAPKRFCSIFFLLLTVNFLAKYFFIKNNIFPSMFTLTRMDQLLLGGLIAFIEWRGLFSSKSIKRMASVLLILSATILVSITLIYGLESTITWLFKHFLIGIFIFSFLLIILSFDNKIVFFLNNILESKLFQYYGRISYGFYVWHLSIITMFYNFFNFNFFFLDLIFTFLTTTLIAHISYFYFESHFLKLKDRFFN